MRNTLIYISFFTIFCQYACQDTTNKNIEPPITNAVDLDSFTDISSAPDLIIYKREVSDNTEDFIKKCNSQNLSLNHPIIETEAWISGVQTILTFQNRLSEDEIELNIEATLYFSQNGIEYKSMYIDTYFPEGNKPEIESVFFANADEDSNKELLVICSWKQSHKKSSEGVLYATYIYDDFSLIDTPDSLVYLEEISNHFGYSFEGTQEDETVISKYKSADNVLEELNRIGF